VVGNAFHPIATTPSQFYVLNELPRNANGKVDRPLLRTMPADAQIAPK